VKTYDLGKIEQVDVREIWEKEDTEFTPWLAKQENIERLGLALGIDLVVEAEEKEVGPFRADILCKNEATEEWVLIENQLEKTDHKHLGQLLTYATGLEAVTIVWVAKDFSEEHRAALDWLNKITEEKYTFFGIKIEILRIGESMAPNFKVVSQPNDWSKSISSAVSKITSEDLSETKLMQLDFHNEVCNKIKSRNLTNLKIRKAFPQAYHIYAIGKSVGHLAHVWNTRENTLVVEIYFPKDKSIIENLHKDKDEIENEFGENLDWQFLPNKIASRIALTRENTFLKQKENWDQYIDWAITKLDKLYQVFHKRL